MEGERGWDPKRTWGRWPLEKEDPGNEEEGMRAEAVKSVAHTGRYRDNHRPEMASHVSKPMMPNLDLIPDLIAVFTSARNVILSN